MAAPTPLPGNPGDPRVTADRNRLIGRADISAIADFNYAEIAVALGVRAGTAGSRLNRARKRVRKALGDEEKS